MSVEKVDAVVGTTTKCDIAWSIAREFHDYYISYHSCPRCAATILEKLPSFLGVGSEYNTADDSETR